MENTTATIRYVDEFDLTHSLCGFGKQTRPGLSVDGHPLTMEGTVYDHGFGIHPEGAVGFRLNGGVQAFDAIVGLDDDCKTVPNKTPRRAQAVFRVWADGKVVFTTPTINEGQQPQTIHVNLCGVRECILETRSVAPWTGFEADNTDWADARFTCAADATIEILDDPRLFAQAGILTPPELPQPVFHGAQVWGVRPGHPVIFRVPVSGCRPMTFRAANLPDGVIFDAERGVLRGTAPAAPGNYPVTVTATNAYGVATRVIMLAVGDTICLTPPMGWNSWNIWGPRFNGEHAMDAARALDESGLGNYGWAYINLDDFWEMNNAGRPELADRPELVGPARDDEGRIIPNPSFPDMRKLTDTVHSYGFKAGLYSSPGKLTCGLCEGSLGHELEDATSYANWGFDYLKYDWCSYDEEFKKESGWSNWAWTWRNPTEPLDKPAPTTDQWAKPYRLMNQCLRKQNRDIVFAFCQYGCGEVEKWGKEAGANVWRSWQDLKDTWVWMENAIEGTPAGVQPWTYAKPGCWPDPDMMIIGQQRSFGNTHPTCLTPNEQYTHVSIWAITAAPMLIGTDLTRLDPFTRSLLTNHQVIAISQDPLGRAARRVRYDDTAYIWTRELGNGDLAVAIVNRFPLGREMSVSFTELGIGGEWNVLDCWSNQNEGPRSDSYAAFIPPHGVKLLRLSQVACPRCN